MWQKIVIVVMLIVIISTVTIWAKDKKPSKEDIENKFKKTPIDSKNIVNGNNTFALDMYASLSHGEGNVFFSPYSISSALAMTYAGARGNTETQMAQTLHFKLDQELLHPTFALLNKELAADKKKGYQLNIANALWGQQGYKFLPSFLAITNLNYGAGLKEVDFAKDTEGARKTINDWVEKETQDKIKELIKAGMLTDLTRFVLTNAIYFKGDWASKFNKDKTKEDSFTLISGEKIKTPMMYQSRNFKYTEREDLQIIELPYITASALSMVIFLPKQMDGITNCEKAFNLNNIEQWLSNLHQTKVDVYLPRFTTTYECELSERLSFLGMSDAFDAAKADFSGMTTEGKLCISKVIHKAFVDVNEEGTEAAAATATSGVTGMPHITEFRADRPFIFLIRDMRSGSILFIGRITDPRG